MGVPALIHQPSYSMINRWTEEDGLLDTLEAAGMGCISFVPLAQGLLTNKYLKGIPEGSRATQASPSTRTCSPTRSCGACAASRTSRSGAASPWRSSRCRGCCGTRG